MTTIHQTATTNVEASLNSWFTTAIAAVTRPAWLPAPTVVFTVPESTAVFPTISCVHLGGARLSRYQGNAEDGSTKARLALGVMDLSCWTSRSSVNWQAQLRALVDMVEHVVTRQSGAAIIVKDYLSNQSSPSDTTYRVVLMEMELVNTAPDPNPDIERRRIVVNYQWNLRSS